MKKFFSNIFQKDQVPPTGRENRNAKIRKVEDPAMKFKFQQRKKYMMRVVVRGPSKCGKTALCSVLQGKEFPKEYDPTESIETGVIHWNYRNADDVIILEVWDVPNGKKKSKKLKLDHSAHVDEDSLSDESDESDKDEEIEQKLTSVLKSVSDIQSGSHTVQRLDATTIDVYKGANCVILIFDIRKKKSWDWVKKEVSRISKDLEIVVLANFRDQDEMRVVFPESIKKLEKKYPHVKVIETCVLNNYGLKELFSYFNVPFLRMKLEQLKKEMKIVKDDLAASRNEVDVTVEANNYEGYLKRVQSDPDYSIPFHAEFAARKKPNMAAQAKPNVNPVQVAVKSKSPNTPKSNTPKSPKGDKSRKVPQQQDITDIPDHLLKKYNLLSVAQEQMKKNIGTKEDLDTFAVVDDVEGFYSDSESDTIADTGVTPYTLTQKSDSESDSESERPLPDIAEVNENYVLEEPKVDNSKAEVPKKVKRKQNETPTPKSPKESKVQLEGKKSETIQALDETREDSSESPKEFVETETQHESVNGLENTPSPPKADLSRKSAKVAAVVEEKAMEVISEFKIEGDPDDFFGDDSEDDADSKPDENVPEEKEELEEDTEEVEKSSAKEKETPAAIGDTLGTENESIPDQVETSEVTQEAGEDFVPEMNENDDFWHEEPGSANKTNEVPEESFFGYIEREEPEEEEDDEDEDEEEIAKPPKESKPIQYLQPIISLDDPPKRQRRHRKRESKENTEEKDGEKDAKRKRRRRRKKEPNSGETAVDEGKEKRRRKRRTSKEQSQISE